MGDAGHPARRDRRERHRGPARARPDRHRSPRGPGHRGPRGLGRWEVASFPTGTFADLEQVRRHRPLVVLDVRRADEYDSTRIEDAVNIPIHQLPKRAEDVPEGEPWLYCAGGYRASTAASILDAAGRRLVAIDDSFENAETVGLPLVGPDA
jgi:hydroxyacylglutathione hydrolase